MQLSLVGKFAEKCYIWQLISSRLSASSAKSVFEISSVFKFLLGRDLLVSLWKMAAQTCVRLKKTL